RFVGDPAGIALGRGSAFGDDLYVMDPQGASSQPPILEAISPTGQVRIFADAAPWTVDSLPLHIEFGTGNGFGEYLYVGDSASRKIWRVAPTSEITEFPTSNVLTPVSLRFSSGGSFGSGLFVLTVEGILTIV